MRAALLVATVCVCVTVVAPARAGAPDTLSGLRGLLEERQHRIELTLAPGHATLVVQRTVENVRQARPRFSRRPRCGQPCGTGDVASSCNDERDTCDYVAHVCAARIPVGGACTFGYPPFCVDYAECEGATCVQRPGLGASCDPLLPASECLGSLACDAATALCTPRSAGGSCR